MNLNSIEMAVVAEVDLEMARGYEEVVRDTTRTAETRWAAQEAASRWRERARLYSLEARRRAAEPLLPGERSASQADRLYFGPEQREQERRVGERRGNGSAAAGYPGVLPFGRDRRINPDRRQGDRRR
jgi:hypothetical protein